MKQFVRGQKSSLKDLTAGTELTVTVKVLGNMVFDISCFGLDVADKLSDDRYFIFFNQKSSPCGSLTVLGAQGAGEESFKVKLDSLPASIRKLVFTVTIDGAGTMSQIQQGKLQIFAQQTEVANFNFSGKDFKDEKAIIVGELYHKDIWRFAAVGQGFNGGLSALLKHFGGEELEDTAPPPPPKISLVKKIETEAPRLVELAKTLSVSLEKRNLQDVMAKVALVLDASGSMNHQYRNGDVQRVIDRTVPLAIHFDDDGELDTFVFAEKYLKLGSVTLKNLDNFVRSEQGGWEKWKIGSRFNNEPAVMRRIVDEYQKSHLPVYVLFISDGGVSRNKEIQKIITEASHFPIFWQFVGIGGRNYGILERLDTMSGRFVDNCNFFSLDDIKGISDQELYELLLNEFPMWFNLAKVKGIIR